jgi:hypothetical protein
MFRKLLADKDTYITNKYVDGKAAVSGNVGIAGSLDLYKLYGITILSTSLGNVPQTELSRILIHFDLEPVKKLFSEGKVDITHDSFKCHLQLKDVYGGQPTPNNFTVNVFPLSSSFAEGFGKDTAYYSDIDRCNFLSASLSASWSQKGCEKACFSTGSGDYITGSATILNTLLTQNFRTGEEDLIVDVTKLISATLKGDIPDAGFRISFSDAIEQDNHTYFVKRFGSRHSYDERKRPQISVKFDDSISDDTSNLYLDNASNLFLYNYVQGQLVNLLSASQPVTGSNSLILQLRTQISGVGNYSLYFTGSQHNLGVNFTTGVYYAPVTIPLSNANIKAYYDASGSVTFTPIWKSLNDATVYITGSNIQARAPERISYRLNPRRYTIYVGGHSTDYGADEDVTMRVDIFDENSPIMKAKRLPIETPGVIIAKSHFAVRDISTNEYMIPFDIDYGSSKLSSDSKGMYLNFNTSALVESREYTIDILLIIDGKQQKYLDTTPAFRIKKM